MMQRNTMLNCKTIRFPSKEEPQGEILGVLIYSFSSFSFVTSSSHASYSEANSSLCMMVLKSSVMVLMFIIGLGFQKAASSPLGTYFTTLLFGIFNRVEGSGIKHSFSAVWVADVEPCFDVAPQCSNRNRGIDWFDFEYQGFVDRCFHNRNETTTDYLSAQGKKPIGFKCPIVRQLEYS